MNKIRILFYNINQGTLYRGKTPDGQKQLFTPDNQAHLASLKFSVPEVDVICLAEALLDDENGDSQMVENFKEAYNLEHAVLKINGTCWYDLGNLKNQFYGQAILSCNKLENESYKLIEEPDFIQQHRTFAEEKIDHGSGKSFHNKYIQSVDQETNEKTVKIINLHSIPFHKFGDDPYGQKRMASVRKWWQGLEKHLLDAIKPEESYVITGDFNNSGISIEEALPQLINKHGFKALRFDENDLIHNDTERNLKKGEKPYTSTTQMDFILLSPDMAFNETKVLVTPSDHPALYAEVKI